MADKLIHGIPARFWSVFPQQAMPLGIQQREDSVTNQEEPEKVQQALLKNHIEGFGIGAPDGCLAFPQMRR